jgi:hypothetical protein
MRGRRFFLKGTGMDMTYLCMADTVFQAMLLLGALVAFGITSPDFNAPAPAKRKP